MKGSSHTRDQVAGGVEVAYGGVVMASMMFALAVWTCGTGTNTRVPTGREKICENIDIYRKVMINSKLRGFG
jgi:hypothetical protein